MKKNNIEDLFKDSFENFEAEVSPGVWSNIQTALKGVGIGLLGKALLNKIGTNTIVAVISSAAAIISTVVIINWGGKSETKKPIVSTKPGTKIIVESPKPVKVEEIKEFLSDEKKAPAVEKPVVNEKNSHGTESKTITSIKKDKIKEVINEYSDVSVASIAASPIGGTVPLIVNISNSGNGKINRWDFGDGQKESGANPVHVYDVPGVYTVILSSTAADGKTAIDSVKIEVTGNSSISAIPATFSPNGDGKVDVFTFKSQDISNMNGIICDKNGTIVYKWQGTAVQWDGKDLKGSPAKEGTYFYIVEAVGTDGKKFERKGRINLTR
jgi:gliding motility-associated-like protein